MEHNYNITLEASRKDGKLTVSAHDSDGNTDSVTYTMDPVLSPYMMRKMTTDFFDRFFLAFGLETLMDYSEKDETEMENEQNFFVEYKHFKSK